MLGSVYQSMPVEKTNKPSARESLDATAASHMATCEHWCGVLAV